MRVLFKLRQEALPQRKRLLCWAISVFGAALVGGCSNIADSRDALPPTITITSPATSATYAGGDVITVAASASDPEDGSIPQSQLSWWVIFHHHTHTHPFLSSASGGGGSFAIPRTGEFDTDVFYRVYVAAHDGGGLADTTFVDVMPRLTSLTITTDPAGLEVTLDDIPQVTPLSVASVVGMDRTLGIPTGESEAGVDYVFRSWSQGGAASQTLRMPDTTVAIQAAFADAGISNLPPAVAITTPTASAIVTAGSPISVDASASDEDGSVTHVEFFEGSTKLADDSAPPFATAWTPIGTGVRQLTARATDNRGAYAVSSPITVTVQAPGSSDGIAPVATLTDPATGSVGLTGTVSLAATATDNVGVTGVEFQVDGVTLTLDTTAPYTAQLSSTAAFASGAHVLRARAEDAAGNWSDWSSSIVTFGGNVALPQGFTSSTFVSGFGDILTAVAQAPDGRFFVSEKSGALRIVKNGVLLATPFIKLPVTDLGERGLLGIAFSPDFATSHFVYVYYTTTTGGAHNRISRFVADGDVAHPAGETVLVDLPLVSDAAKHNGGAMNFGGDGKLYVSVGDNAEGGDAQLLSFPFGKILRFNSDGSIPTDNPFYAQASGVNRAIWAMGLRNPFTFAIEPGTGRMYINDVGLGTWEEINRGRAGANFGWPDTEGATTNPAFDTPILSYKHTADSPTLFSGNAVVGAAFYHPSVNLFGDAYVGSYFFADYVAGWIYRLDPANGDAAYAFAQVGGNPTDLIVGADGALYVLNGTEIDRIGK